MLYTTITHHTRTHAPYTRTVYTHHIHAHICVCVCVCVCMSKEIREHEFVAQTLLAKLSDLGATTRRPREIMDLERLVHFHSGIDVELTNIESIDRLVRVLHPTPALGPLPRTEETMTQLLAWRARLDCPLWFGAPFGMWREGVFEALVAIRMVAWKGAELFVPSGCGVIEESRLVNEWRELRLKREAVRAAFGL